MTATSFECPRCGGIVLDPLDVDARFCTDCGAFTGECAAGRALPLVKIGWTVPCPALATMPWRLQLLGAVVLQVGLCDAHGTQLELQLSPSIVMEDRP